MSSCGLIKTDDDDEKVLHAKKSILGDYFSLINVGNTRITYFAFGPRGFGIVPVQLVCDNDAKDRLDMNKGALIKFSTGKLSLNVLYSCICQRKSL